MPILLANTEEEEIAALRAATVAALVKTGARRWESEPWCIAGLNVQCIAEHRKAHRGGRPTNIVRWRVEGKMRGINALLWSVRRLRGAALRAQ